MKEYVLVTAGGTGGHIAPGIALAEELQKRNEKFVFLSLEKNRNFPDFLKSSFPVEFYGAPSLSGGTASKLLFPFRLLFALFQVFRLSQKYGFKSFICMGGFPTLPAAIYAVLFRVPLYLCEQNAMPGKVTVMFAKFAKNIFLNFPDGSGKLIRSGGRLRLSGNPLRRSIIEHAREGREEKSGPLTVLVLGGSQGAVQLNEMSIAAIPELPDLKWIVQCGEKNIKDVEKALAEKNIQDAVLFGYHTEIHKFYREADILVCRAGAGVLSEGAIFSLPMILVPYPYAADDHQSKNAVYLEEKGAAFVIHTKGRESDELIGFLKKLKMNPDLRKSMGKNAFLCSGGDAAQKIIECVLENKK